MAIGSRIVAPEGYQSIAKDDYVYFLSRGNESVCLVRYLKLKNGKWRAKPFTLNAMDFESALKLERLCVDLQVGHLPPWFPEGITSEWAINRYRSNPKSNASAKRHSQDVLSAIKAVGRDFGAAQNDKEFNKYAKSQRLNSARTRTRVLSYILFGESEWVLQPANWTLGQYKRLKGGSAKLGRPSNLGREYGKRITIEDVELFKQGYRRFHGLGKSQVWIYLQTLRRLYKVKPDEIVKVKGGYKRILRADGTSVPSIYQFRYQLKKLINADQIYKDRFGKEKLRNKKGHKGTYAEWVSSLMEVVERDAYVRKETLIFDGGKDLGKLYVVHLVDRLSSAIVGIGFSLGSETKMAYRMAEFCSAIDKGRFLQLMGVEGIDPDDWPCIGIPGMTVTDRGPGAGENNGAAISELTPSHSPQSKPMVENSNPKSDQFSGPPQYQRTSLSPIMLMRVAIREAIQANLTKDVSGRLSNEMIINETTATPMGIWRDMDSRLRNHAGMISFEEAVRRYLEPLKVKVRCDGIYKGDQRYHNLEVVELGLLDDAAQGVYELNAYWMPINVRQLWIETESGLLQVEAAASFMDHEEQLFITAEEQTQLQQLRSSIKAPLGENKVAVSVEMDLLAMDDNGIGMHTGKLSSKRPLVRGRDSSGERRRLQSNGSD
jgi:hypothetical protein